MTKEEEILESRQVIKELEFINENFEQSMACDLISCVN
jgi:hypothetical protein